MCTYIFGQEQEEMRRFWVATEKLHGRLSVVMDQHRSVYEIFRNQILKPAQMHRDCGWDPATVCFNTTTEGSDILASEDA